MLGTFDISGLVKVGRKSLKVGRENYFKIQENTRSLKTCGCLKLSLDEYKSKRNFGKTAEPEAAKRNGTGDVYVIQKHDASHLHYDLRLEMDGVLKSWAVPKEPPLIEGVKRLAVQVEDHPLSYAGFEGTIPEGEYGAGTVEIWDRGTYKTLDRKEDKLVIHIIGQRLSGEYVLVRLKDKKNWLFFKKK